MSSFETHPKSLKFLLNQIHNGELALPDFQRDFVWEPSAVEELIESIMRAYPAGSLLFLKHSGEGFQVREFEGAPGLKSAIQTSYLVMDGQQRMTSLYQAFYGKGEHLFFLSVEELAENEDVETAVWHESRKRAERLKLDDIKVQAEKLFCPLRVIMTEGFDAWIDEIMDHRPEKGDQAKELRTMLRQVNKDWISKILDYQFPVIFLAADTPMDAVCKMFETLNRRGVKLTVFELLMARSFMNNVSLRQLWDKANEDFPVFEEFNIDPYYILQTISLLVGKTLKRKEILDMEPEVLNQNWKAATEGMAEAIHFLRRNAGILSQNLLPYHTMLIPMAATWARTKSTKGPAETSRRDKIKTWFWASVFCQAYEKGPTSRAVSDFKDLNKWIAGEEVLPWGVRTLHFNPDLFKDITPKQRALYRGTLALSLANRALDFHKAEPLTFDYLDANKVDDHHIFPQAFLRRQNEDDFANCVLNKTLIDKITNIRISDKAPSKYLKEIEKEVGQGRLEQILASHLIPSEELRADDFESFLQRRAKMLFEELKTQVGREIPTTPVAYVEESEEQFEEEEEKSNPRERHDPKVVNALPVELLQNHPKAMEELFVAFTERLLEAIPSAWWKSSKSRVAFWSPEKNLFRIRISKSLLHFTIFTDGKPLDLTTPIVQRDRGGELWGRFKVRTIADISAAMPTILESHRRLLKAIEERRPTSWWAMASKNKEADL
jgi:hypothetical protein